MTFMKTELKLTFFMAFMFSLLFCRILIRSVESQSVKTIFIRANGSVEGTDMIQRDGDLYLLKSNLLFGIQVQKSNIIVDGAGFTLQGDGGIYGPTDTRGMGLEIVECKNVTIRNLNIKEFTRGIRFTNSSDCNIYHNILFKNSIGIEMGYPDEYYSNNNTVSGNLVKENNNAGIRLIYGSSNSISGNIITANDEGISVWESSDNNITLNNITSNNRGIYIERSGINSIHHNNFVDNKNDWWDYGLTPWPFQLPFSINIWDDSSEGNYWINYSGPDNDSNGIGDIPHKLYENNTDDYPLMNPVAVPEFINDESTKSTEEPFPMTLIGVASGVSVVITTVSLLVYYKKRKH